MADVEIRPATVADAAIIVELIRKLAIYEKRPAEIVKITEGDVRRDSFGTPRRFEVLMAQRNGEIVGFALFFPTYSTWDGRPGVWVEDLFVEEDVRRHGVGRKLLAAVARIAKAKGCSRIGLNVLDWNPARKFYERLGFVTNSGWMQYGISGAALEHLVGKP